MDKIQNPSFIGKGSPQFYGPGAGNKNSPAYQASQAKSLYSRSKGVSKSAAVGALKKASGKNLAGMLANAKLHRRSSIPVKSKPASGGKNYNPQS